MIDSDLPACHVQRFSVSSFPLWKTVLNGHLDSVSSLYFRGFPLDTFIEIFVVAQRYEHFKVSASCVLEWRSHSPRMVSFS